VKRYIVTVVSKDGCKQTIGTWASSPEWAIKQVSNYFLCPTSICAVEAADPPNNAFLYHGW